MDTLKELDQWMTNNCYRNDSYAIAGRKIYEGFGLEKRSDKYIWYYTERGQEQIVEEFINEFDAVKYAHTKIINDKFADRHMIAFYSTKKDISSLLKELANRSISYQTGELYYRQNDYRTMVFVFGCDVKKVQDLKKKYYEL